MTWEVEAKTFCGAIRALAADDAALDNFESYLTHHFEAWQERYARTLRAAVHVAERVQRPTVEL